MQDHPIFRSHGAGFRVSSCRVSPDIVSVLKPSSRSHRAKLSPLVNWSFQSSALWKRSAAREVLMLRPTSFKQNRYQANRNCGAGRTRRFLIWLQQQKPISTNSKARANTKNTKQRRGSINIDARTYQKSRPLDQTHAANGNRNHHRYLKNSSDNSQSTPKSRANPLARSAKRLTSKL